MAEVDRITARALAEAGYVPLRVYLERFAPASCHDREHVDAPSTAPDAGEAAEPVLQAYVSTMIERY
jgi:hypothetical protein